MDRDRSLDEFVGGESDGSAAPDADEDPADSDVDDDSDPVDSDVDDDSDAAGSDADHDSDAADRAPDTDGSGAAGDDDVEPAAVTYRWDPDGVRCAECGSTAGRLWTGESGQVCAACKEW